MQVTEVVTSHPETDLIPETQMSAAVEAILGPDPAFRATMRASAVTSEDESRSTQLNIARQAEEAWRLKDVERAKKKRKAQLDLEKDTEEFGKRFAVSAPDRVILLSDDDSDEEDELRRSRLLSKFNCVIANKGAHALDVFGQHQAPTIVKIVVKEEVAGPSATGLGGEEERLNPQTPGDALTHATSTCVRSPLMDVVSADVKEELIQGQYHLKSKSAMEAAIEEKLNSRFDEVLDSHFNKRMRDLKSTFLKEFEEEVREGRLTIVPNASTPGFVSGIQFGVSEAGSPQLAVPVLSAAVEAEIPSNALVSPILNQAL